MEGRRTRFLYISLLLMIILATIFLAGSQTLRLATQGSTTFTSPSGVHRSYWLKGDGALGWNNSLTGPTLSASDGDLVTIYLQGTDSMTHNWYLDFNNNYRAGSIVSLDFTHNVPNWYNFTFLAVLNQTTSFPHGGTFTYRCGYHQTTMVGSFKFNAGPLSSFTYSPQPPLAGNQVSFNGSASWPSTNAASITTYAWDFGDGNVKSSGFASLTHVYATVGTYVVWLNVTDSASQTAGSTKKITVNNPTPVPFDYSISFSPSTKSIVQGQTGIVVVGLVLVSGTAENVTLSSVLSPSSSAIRVSLDMISGYPSFSAQMSIVTDFSSTIGYYNINVSAMSSSGVAHRATLNISLTANQPSPSLNYALWSTIGALVAASGLVFAWFRISKRKK